MSFVDFAGWYWILGLMVWVVLCIALCWNVEPMAGVFSAGISIAFFAVAFGFDWFALQTLKQYAMEDVAYAEENQIEINPEVQEFLDRMNDPESGKLKLLAIGGAYYVKHENYLRGEEFQNAREELLTCGDSLVSNLQEDLNQYPLWD